MGWEATEIICSRTLAGCYVPAGAAAVGKQPASVLLVPQPPHSIDADVNMRVFGVCLGPYRLKQWAHQDNDAGFQVPSMQLLFPADRSHSLTRTYHCFGTPRRRITRRRRFEGTTKGVVVGSLLLPLYPRAPPLANVVFF